MCAQGGVVACYSLRPTMTVCRADPSHRQAGGESGFCTQAERLAVVVVATAAILHATTCRPPPRRTMKLDGMHHITMITGDAQRNVEFYADVLGLRLVKKTVNFDAPEAYHLYFGDEQGSPGLDPDLVRVRRRAPRPGRRGDDPHDPARRGLRGGARLLGRAARRQRLRQRARRPVAVLRGLRRAAPRARRRRRRQPAAARRAPRGPGRARDPRRRGRARLHRAATSRPTATC